MKNIKLSIHLFLFMVVATSAFADDYPINYSITIKHYRFDIALSDNSNEIFGKASITVLFKKDSTAHLRLDLVNRSEERKGMGMVVDSIIINNEHVRYTHINDAVLIQLAKPPKAGMELIVIVSYHGIPINGLKIGPTKFGDRSFFSENWPNKARHWLPTIDHPYYKATSEFVIKAPAHYKVISNGLLAEESLINASIKLTHWKQSVPVSCWLFVLGVADFAVQYPDQLAGKSIQTWVYPQNREAGFYDFGDVTKKTVQFFSDYIGPYAYEKIANIQAASISGGMETSSAIFYAENLINGKRDVRLRNVIIHELAHQWFGNAVTETTWDDAWLSEGFATFFTLLFIENEYGHDQYTKGLISARKTVYEAAAKDPGFSLVDNRSAEKGPVTSAITYQKGAWVLHMLRDIMGEESFKKGIQSYYTHFINANTTTREFIAEMEKAYGKDLGQFFNQWLYKAENPVLQGNWKYNKEKKQIIIHLEQTQSSKFIFDLPLEVGIYKKGNVSPQIIKFRIDKKMTDKTIPLDVYPEKILIDPRVVLLAVSDFEEKKPE